MRPYRLLDEATDLSAGGAGAGNLLIQGDNLETLKALMPFHAGRVKCIYIDPPYNTRSAFEHYDDSLEHCAVAGDDVAAFGTSARSFWRRTARSGYPSTTTKGII